MNIKTASDMLRHITKEDPRQAVMLWGAPGIGKSQLVYQLARETNREVVELRLSQMDSVDLLGVPSVTNGRTSWNVPSLLPTKNNPTILFLDEINAGSRATMAAAMQLILDRTLGDYRVPDNTLVLAAGNRTEDRAVANAMPSALANRFLHIEIEPDLDSFLEWGMENGLPMQLLQFLRYRPELLHKQGKGKDIKGFPSPRSWEFLSRQNFLDAPEEIRPLLIQSAVGEGAMVELEAFLQVFASLPSLTSILADPDHADLPREASAKFAVASALAAKASETNIDKIIRYLSRLETEFALMGVQDIAKLHPELQSTRAFTEWEIRNHSKL